MGWNHQPVKDTCQLPKILKSVGLDTTPKFDSSPLKIDRNPKGNESSKHPFSGVVLNFGGVSFTGGVFLHLRLYWNLIWSHLRMISSHNYHPNHLKKDAQCTGLAFNNKNIKKTDVRMSPTKPIFIRRIVALLKQKNKNILPLIMTGQRAPPQK